MRHALVLLVSILFLSHNSIAQAPKKPASTDIYHSLQKLNFLGKALYLAAHPDDENTRLISYLSNQVKAKTAYLSLTRGDGGQNLIGPELRELLGVLRTQELLAARGVDGGEQFFTRANDFGFSKHPKETLSIWDKDAVLGDVVWAIRNFKPDIIINRFDHRTPGTTHGHHTTSAILSVAAFDLANDASAYPSQLSITEVWQPRRVFFNTSWFFYGSRENFEKADKSRLLNVDVGVYYPLKGLSNNEIASLASSKHLCQGFGRLTTRGSQEEYVELIKGDLPQNKNDLFEGINTTWSRIAGGQAVGEILYAVEKNFNFSNPAAHLPDLMKAYKLVQELKDPHWKAIKTQELQEIIVAASGLYLEASAQESYLEPGGKTTVQIEAINRSNTSVVLNSIEVTPNGKSEAPKLTLSPNKRERISLSLEASSDINYTSPYWLMETGTLGMYTVDDQTLIGKPETPRAYNVQFSLTIEGFAFNYSKPIVYRYSKPDKGELYQPFEILPRVTSFIEDKVLIFSDAKPKTIPVKIKAGANDVAGNITLNVPKDWRIEPQNIDFTIAQKNDEKTVSFTVFPPQMESEGNITSEITIDGEVFPNELVEIAYDHVPKQSILLPSAAKVVRLNVQRSGEHIGYIAGAGDKIPESLAQIGYTVHTIDPKNIAEGTLEKYDAIVLGIRAYNVVNELRFKQRFLLDYVEEGGNLIIQYNTTGRRGLGIDNLAPYPIELSRDRVTDENAEVKVLAKQHALVNFPNKITSKDFEGWVQERGLYFPKTWAPEFTPILSMHDEGETPKDGSLIVAPYGKGNYIYTGLSFFRELPAGVPGAFKLFANMLSLGREKIEQEKPIKG